MRHARVLLALVAVAAVMLASGKVWAEPPGDLTVTAIQFVAKAPAGQEVKPDTQHKLLAAQIHKAHPKARFAVAEEGTVLVAVVPKLAGLRVEHASDCAINSQFQFQAKPELVQKALKRPGIEKLLLAWTQSRHKAPADIPYTFRATQRADITLNREALEAIRTAAKTPTGNTVASR